MDTNKKLEFSEEDMIEFSSFKISCLIDSSGKYKNKTDKQLLQIWKEQRIKTIYYV